MRVYYDRDADVNLLKDKKIVINNTNVQSIQIASHMATKTMYQIIKKQKQFHSAKTILEIMIAKKRNVVFAKNELKKMNRKHQNTKENRQHKV